MILSWLLTSSKYKRAILEPAVCTNKGSVAGCIRALRVASPFHFL